MFWREHSYIAFSTTYVGYLTLRRKSAYLHRKKYHAQLISSDAWQAAAQSNHQYQWEDRFHTIEQEKKGVA